MYFTTIFFVENSKSQKNDFSWVFTERVTFFGKEAKHLKTSLNNNMAMQTWQQVCVFAVNLCKYLENQTTRVPPPIYISFKHQWDSSICL